MPSEVVLYQRILFFSKKSLSFLTNLAQNQIALSSYIHLMKILLVLRVGLLFKKIALIG